MGILYMILSACLQALLSVIIKRVSPTVPVSVQIAAYYFIPVLFFLPFILKNGFSLYKSKRFLTHVMRGIFSISSVSCFFYAIKYLPLAMSATLFNMIPFFVPLISYFLLKERIKLKTYLGLLVALPGVLLLVGTRFSSFSIFHFVIGLSSAVLMATSLVLLKYLVRKKESVNQIVFNQYSSCSLSSLLFIGLETMYHPHTLNLSSIDTTTIFFLSGLSLLSIGIQWCYSKAAQCMDASQFAPFLYLSVPISSFLGFWIWKQSLSLNIILGSFLIFAGLCICSLRRKKPAIISI